MATGERLRRRLVKGLRDRGFLHSDRVAEAFAAVPRHMFVPDQPIRRAYADQAFMVKRIDGMWVSSSSQPSIMAIMLEQMGLEPGQRVLEIGAGSGYNAALLTRLVNPRGRVTTVDIDPEVADVARRRLRAAGVRNARVVAADGGFGEPAGAPYDRIIATASCWQVPQPWIDQLVEGGLLVLPFRLNGVHASMGFRKEGDALVSQRAAMCGFMPLRGAFAPQHTQLTLPDGRVAADMELTRSAQRSLRTLLQDGRKVHVPFPRGRDALNVSLYYLALQGRPILLVLRDVGSWGDMPFVLIASNESIISLPSWYARRKNWLTLSGGNEALDYLRDALARWRDEGRPDVRNLRAVVRPTKVRLGPLPRRANGCYHFRRGEHLYELWFER